MHRNSLFVNNETVKTACECSLITTRVGAIHTMNITTMLHCLIALKHAPTSKVYG